MNDRTADIPRFSSFRPGTLACLGILVLASQVQAGLYCSLEKFADLPAQWRGFLLDQRSLRLAGRTPRPGELASPIRQRYLDLVESLRKKPHLDPAELADLGAAYVRLGEPEKAIELLQDAVRRERHDYRLWANLGTAYQNFGTLDRAADCLREAVRLVPGKHFQAEKLHLRLVQERLRAAARGKNDPGAAGLDDLFGVRFASANGTYRTGAIPPDEFRKLPARSVAVVQQLALWLPADPALLWHLAELANAYGDVRNAAAMMDGCVVEFNLAHPDLRKRRLLLREAADSLPRAGLGSRETHKNEHGGKLVFKSRKPLLANLNETLLQPVDPEGINPLPWDLVGTTTVDERYQPTFPKHLQALKGHEVEMTGFMYPLRPDRPGRAFLFLEFPVGCWFCEMPETTSIVHVVLPEGETTDHRRDLLRIRGRLELNPDDPEDFLYRLRDARIGSVN